MSGFVNRFPAFLVAAVGVMSGVYIFQPALEEISRHSREMEEKHLMEQLEARGGSSSCAGPGRCRAFHGAAGARRVDVGSVDAAVAMTRQMST
ncbi:hypothetical protein AMAG_19489 [Allomyces macrogynus ATCC 38327]|uniref:Uncharacterized protein n=1 Tax=Allomyces macrogynus (strain ATCC 38327) TaxID=578462 RepID=A0A0L0ST42_ALLM3|nr:hypothetical protein AMAG_19489 [Allomyces macrogynus ATCC 38327]|eukprot:KNE65550.1 hypothetical protein AMAG_19489 [Allomyces macrogynus ATCC 38327]